MKVEEIMKQPFVIEDDISIEEAAKLMDEKKIGSLIFVSGKKVIGIITEKDILANLNKNMKVTKIMTKNVYTIGPKEDLREALEIMREKKIKVLPVVEKEELVGVVSISDISEHYEELEGNFLIE